MKVAILGCASSNAKAPFDQDDFEIWGLNLLYKDIPQPKNLTRWFEIHSRQDIEKFKEVEVQGGLITHIDGLNQLPCPIYMQQHYDDIPNSLTYPLHEMIDQFGDYFTSSASYMLALAIHEGYEEIHLHGVDMATDSEYETQRPSCEYFLGIAQGKGIKIYIPSESDLLKTMYLYGYEDEKANAFKAKMVSRLEFMKKMQIEARKQKESAQSILDQYEGAIQDCEHVLKVWGGM